MILGWRCACCGGTFPKGKKVNQWVICPSDCFGCSGDMFLIVEDDEPEPIVYKPEATNEKYSYEGWGTGASTLSVPGMFNYQNLESD